MFNYDKLLEQLLKSNAKSTRSELRTSIMQKFKNQNQSANCANLEDFAAYILNFVHQNTEIYLQQMQETENAKSLEQQAADAKAEAEAADCRQLKEPAQPQITLLRRTISPTPTSSNNTTPQKGAGAAVAAAAELSFREVFDKSGSQSKTSTPQSRRNSSAHKGNASAEGSDALNSTHNKSAGHSFCLGDYITITPSKAAKKKGNQQPQSANKHKTNSAETQKAKKRVVPTTISKRAAAGCEITPFGGDSSFSKDNNILEISQQEIVDKELCSIWEARMNLKQNAQQIKELSNEAVVQSVAVAPISATPPPSFAAAAPDEHLEMPAIVSNAQSDLRILAHIYALLIDMNYTANLLNELSFLLNLLKLHKLKEQPGSGSQQKCQKLLNMPSKCAYFGLFVLDQQRLQLALLDVKSLLLVINHASFCALASKELYAYLRAVYSYKMDLDAKQTQADTSLRFEYTGKIVHFEEERDSRKQFSNNNDFAAFKVQRDIFYAALNMWQTKRLLPSWQFDIAITPQIEEIFKKSENAINMAHFAQLFVAQLLNSANNAETPETVGLDMDLRKFSKLTQRLVTPSNSSVAFQFPENQAFFRDFIAAARSIVFREQLKLSLLSQLLTLNSSSFEQLDLNSTDLNSDGEQEQEDEHNASFQNNNKHKQYLVRAEVLSTMLILAKFLGYVEALPYQQDGEQAPRLKISIERQQLKLRNLLQPSFNMLQVLHEARNGGKLLITLPWLMQYLIMLDNISLQLNAYRELCNELFALYMQLGSTGQRLQLRPTACFIMRCCLGWLFETKHIIAQQYYDYRSAHVDDADEMWQHCSSIELHDAAADVENSLRFNAMLEAVLIVACSAFLPHFRVSIMPANSAKTQSRTGGFRHIKTSVAELSSKQPQQQQQQQHDVKNTQQNKLWEAFLQAQSANTRCLIDFVIERSYKSMVKDAQLQILLPLKAAADAQVNEISDCNVEQVKLTVAKIYDTARCQSLMQWNILVPGQLKARVQNALSGLMPDSTNGTLKRTYFALIHKTAREKVQNWCNTNLFRKNFYCDDLQEMAEKICKANAKERPAALSTELIISAEAPSVADIIEEMQRMLHCTSMRADLIPGNATLLIIHYLHRLQQSFLNTLPTIFYRLIGQYIVQLLQHLILKYPEYTTDDLIEAACQVMMMPQMLDANKISSTVPAILPNITRATATLVHATVAAEQAAAAAAFVHTQCQPEPSSQPELIPNIYGGLINVVFLRSLYMKRNSYERLQQLLFKMIVHEIVTLDFVNNLFLSVLRVSWSPEAIDEFTKMLHGIEEQLNALRGLDYYRTDQAAEKSHLLTQFLYEFLTDI